MQGEKRSCSGLQRGFLTPQTARKQLLIAREDSFRGSLGLSFVKQRAGCQRQVPLLRYASKVIDMKKAPGLPIVVVLIATLFVMPIQAQILKEDSAAAHWRAASRLGYGVSTTAPAGGAKAWGMQQLQAAQLASTSSARIPEHLRLIDLPVAQVSRRYHEERESRRLGRAQAAAPGMNEQSAALSPQVAALGSQTEHFSRDMAQGIAAWRLHACSKVEIEQPLLARMTEFWFNHFNVFVGKGTVRPYVASYVLHAIRPHALGKFEDLVLATAQHPAMLLYLDQAQSNSRGLNENYARELMELHTLGVNGGYSQQDVQALARILTGWSVDIANGTGFLFRPGSHDRGTHSIMGTAFAQAGQQQGVEAIRFLARHPATAQRIATRLATFFVADTPPPALVKRLAETFTQSGGDMAQVMRSLIESPEFWDSNNELFKTPLDYTCSSLAATPDDTEPLAVMQNLRQSLSFLNQTGQPLHGWQTPDGYKTDAATWLAPEALTRRADYAFGLAPRMSEPTYLAPYFSPRSRERIAQESGNTRTALWLSAPDFMRK
jgi:uncharacterized protein (DUF1800 family)